MKYRLLILSLLFCGRVVAQDFGAYPPSIRWKQIDNDTIRVIFPEGMDAQAQRAANVTTYLQRYHTKSIGYKHRKIDIVLRNQTVISNAYVGLGPYRSEFFTTPPSQSDELGSIPWIDQLSIHEYRHVEQFSNAYRGVSLLGAIFAGDGGFIAMADLSVPDWFWEGDAVSNETAVSQQGRGRIPSFYQEFRALELSGQRFTYEKIRNGSYRDYVPNHYYSGYLMCSYARNYYGNGIWNPVFSRAVSYSSLLYPFSNALKSYTGLSTRDLYQTTLNDYALRWKEEIAALRPVKLEPFVRQNNTDVYTEYLYPAYVGNGMWICRKSSFKQPATFIRIDAKGNESNICSVGISIEDNFSYSSGLIAWTQYRPSARWTGVDYSDIELYNIDTGTHKKLTVQGKYFSPGLSSDGKRVASIFVSINGASSIRILDVVNGEIVKELSSDLYFFTNPVFDASNQNIITVVRDKSGRMAMAIVNINSAEIELLTPISFHIINRPLVVGNEIYFTASYSGIDNVFKINDKKEIVQLSSVTTGASSPGYDNDQKRLLIPVYSPKGYELNYLSENNALNQTVTVKALTDVFSGVTKYAREEGGNILDSVPFTKRPVESYSKMHGGLLNIHSWEIVNGDVPAGAYIYSENILNTLSITGGVLYNKNEKKPYFIGEVLYGQYYPVFHLYGSYSFDSQTVNNQTAYFNQQQYRAGVQLPLNLSDGNFSRSMAAEGGYLRYQIGATYLSQYEAKGYLSDNQANGYYGSFSFSNALPMAKQNLSTPFGQSLVLNYQKLTNGILADRFRADILFVSRGLTRNQSLKLLYNYGKQSTNSLLFSFPDDFYYSYGFKSIPFSDITHFRISYQLPLFYPDMGAAGVFYLSRVRLGGNFDTSHANMLYSLTNSDGNKVNTLTMNSIGAELTFDTKWFNIVPITWGVRYNYLLGNVDKIFKGNQIEMFMYPITF
jgi:hypothetical protein